MDGQSRPQLVVADAATIVLNLRSNMPKTKKAKTDKKQSKVGFIRSVPASMPVAEVVAKAKDQGMKIAETYVHWARWQSKRAAKKKSSKAKLTAAAKPTTRTAKPQSKAAFIRTFPASVRAKEVVAKARATGITIHVNQVYKVRGSRKMTTTKTKVTKLAARTARTPRNGASVPSPVTTRSSAEDLLRAIAAEIGLGLAVGILAEERAKIRAVIGA